MYAHVHCTYYVIARKGEVMNLSAFHFHIDEAEAVKGLFLNNCTLHLVVMYLYSVSSCYIYIYACVLSEKKDAVESYMKTKR